MEHSRKARPPSLPARSGDDSRFSSVRSKGSKTRSTVSDETDSSGEDSDVPTSRVRRRSSVKKTDTPSSRPPSRPQSRSGRKRTDSTVSTTTEKGEKKEKDKEKERADKNASKRMSIGGWASSIGKMTGRGKNKDKGKFDSLMADDIEDDDSDTGAGADESSTKPAPSTRSSSPIKSKIISRGNTPNASPKIPGRISKPPSQQDKKIAVALHDFAAASNDELSFKAGDKIVVLNEVIDGWWMGEHSNTGKTGLFPTTYTEVLNASTSSLGSKPPLPRRPSSTALQPSLSRSAPSSPANTKTKPPTMQLKKAEYDAASPSSDVDHPFGDSYMAASRSPLNGGFYEDSITSDNGRDDDDDEARLVPEAEDSDDGLHVYRSAPPAPPVRRMSIPSSKKTPPPPPPPRRSTTHLSVPQVPPRPGISRSNSSTRTNSTNNSFVSVDDVQAEQEFTSSPFDNPKDGCGDFKQNPFKPKGFCNNCFQMHG